MQWKIVKIPQVYHQSEYATKEILFRENVIRLVTYK